MALRMDGDVARKILEPEPEVNAALLARSRSADRVLAVVYIDRGFRLNRGTFLRSRRMDLSQGNAWALRLILFVAPLSLTLLVANAQQNARSFADNFTGEIEVVDSSEMRSSRIRFEAGARTNWHTHSERQLILIEQGQGRVQEMGSPIRILAAGESYYTEAGVPHWHGADPEQPAVQFSVYSGTLDWGRPVTDEEYLER